MEGFKVSNLKDWREKLEVSQKRLAELAKVSLTTLRHLESGLHKPQGRTVKKIFEILRSVQAGYLSQADIKPPRKRRKGSAAEQPAEVQAKQAVMAAPTALPPVPAPKAAGIHTAASTSVQTGAPQLSNIDLELINRVLNMNITEKVTLLEKLLTH